MWAHLGAMLAHLGGYVGPSWGYVLCWPILRLCWPILRPMLVGPCWPMLTHLEPQEPKKCKKREEHKTLTTQDFLAGPRGRRQGRRPLSPTERRDAYGKDTARGPVAGIYKGCIRTAAPAADPGQKTRTSLASFFCLPPCYSNPYLAIGVAVRATRL